MSSSSERSEATELITEKSEVRSGRRRGGSAPVQDMRGGDYSSEQRQPLEGVALLS